MPELAEPIEYINEQLAGEFGRDTVTGQPIWKVVWADDVLEFQYGEHVDTLPSGSVLRRITEKRLVKKYLGHEGKYLLVQLVLVPETDQERLCGAKISYEPMWPFEDKKGNYLPPRLDVCRLVVDAVHRAKGKPRVKDIFKDPISKDDVNGIRARRARVDEIKQQLFSDETDLTDNLSTGQGVVISNVSFWDRRK